MFGDKLKQLEKRSTSAINVFQKTIDSINKTNDAIVAEKEKKISKIKKLQSETVALTALESANSRIASKMQVFLEE